MMWLSRPTSSGSGGHLGWAADGGRRGRRRVRIGAPDRSLTPVSGMVVVTELVERLDVIGRLDTAIGPIKQRRRGHSGGQLLVGMAASVTGWPSVPQCRTPRCPPAAVESIRVSQVRGT